MSRYKIDCLVGARPNFMKIAPVMRALTASGRCAPRLIHTGQHYDVAMSEVFFKELDIPHPDINLEIGSGSNTQQTARIMMALEPLMADSRPDMLVVVGDVNSTIAGALVAARLGVPVAHVEAGLRSNDLTMPEEINRLVTDRLSSLLLTTERSGVDNLAREGVDPARVAFVGNVMIDSLLASLPRAVAPPAAWREAGASDAFMEAATAKGYALATLHRPSNVDEPSRLADVLATLAKISRALPIVFPMHPRTRANMEKHDLARLLDGAAILTTGPLSYLRAIGQMKGARLVITDSGGIQEETTALGVPCLTVRDNTERPITIEEGTNTLVGTSTAALLKAVDAALAGTGKRGRIPELWDGRAAERIAARLIAFLDAAQGVHTRH